MTCDLCHEECTTTYPRGRFRLCDRCADGWDYHASLTPTERRAEERAIAAYCDDIEDSGAAVAPANGAQPKPQTPRRTT